MNYKKLLISMLALLFTLGVSVSTVAASTTEITLKVDSAKWGFYSPTCKYKDLTVHDAQWKSFPCFGNQHSLSTGETYKYRVPIVSDVYVSFSTWDKGYRCTFQITPAGNSVSGKDCRVSGNVLLLNPAD